MQLFQRRDLRQGARSVAPMRSRGVSWGRVRRHCSLAIAGWVASPHPYRLILALVVFLPVSFNCHFILCRCVAQKAAQEQR